VQVEATTARPLATDADTIAVGLFERENVVEDVADGGAIHALVESGEARAELGRVAIAHAEQRRFLVVGLGQRDRFGPEEARLAAAAADKRAADIGTDTLCWDVPADGEGIAVGIVEGTLLHAYRFDRYKAAEDRPAVTRLIVCSGADVSGPVDEAALLTAAQNRARDLANTPPNDMTPQRLADYAQRLDGVWVDVWDERRIRDAGMGAFAAVAQGSDEGARMILLRYEGSGDGPLLGLVGKAITFDSGGLSLKSRDQMIEMKFDMSGGAAVIESVAALQQLRVPVRVLGVVGAAENLPSGAASRPGDIVSALDGTTIEINNTDAEGRLVLADCISYARREGCERLVDIATLTAVDAALGSTYAGLMCNDDGWARRVEECGAHTGELVWRLPLHQEFAEMMKGRYATLTNRSWRREAFPVTAAEFLHHFAGEVPWAHLDIAGMAYDVPRRYFVGKGATGFGVRLLVEIARRLTR
jgi:leucyl aminopeptidase